MDAYTNYIMGLTDARVGELRREAAEYALSRSAREARPSWWSRARNALRRPPVPVVEPLATLSLATSVVEGEELRRSA